MNSTDNPLYNPLIVPENYQNLKNDDSTASSPGNMDNASEDPAADSRHGLSDVLVDHLEDLDHGEVGNIESMTCDSSS